MTRWHEAATTLFDQLLARTHLSKPSDVARIIAEEATKALEATEVVLYWANRERTHLMPLANPASPHRAPQDVEGSLAGRCFTTSKILSVPSPPDQIRAFVPVMDGTDRVGALELELPRPDATDHDNHDGVGHDGADLSHEAMVVLERFGHAVAMVLVSKMVYGDTLELVQRSRTMSVGAELVWSMVPPLTFATDGLVISAMLEPAYDNGGDAFDYAVNNDTVHLAVFDGVGHGLGAAGLSTFAIAAYRHSRRTGLDLVGTYEEMDTAITRHHGQDRFVTAVVGQLDQDTGYFHWVNAGHPPPLLLRESRVVKVLTTQPATPLGMPMFNSTVQVHEERLQPGDALVFYTDGITESRRPDGSLLSLEGLIEFLEHEAAAQQPAPETLRRLQRTLERADGAALTDDATVLMAEWRSGTEESLLPQSAGADPERDRLENRGF